MFLVTDNKLMPVAIIEIGIQLVKSSKSIGAGMATCGLIGAGIGVGVVSGSFPMALSKNPEQTPILFRYAILGFASTEAVGSSALMIAFIILSM